jgi:hypothetical protein
MKWLVLYCGEFPGRLALIEGAIVVDALIMKLELRILVVKVKRRGR